MKLYTAFINIFVLFIFLKEYKVYIIPKFMINNSDDFPQPYNL
jgi:hypothetical protein